MSWKDVPPTPNVPAYRLYDFEHAADPEALETPDGDTREYRLLELHNGLRALLVRDPDADKAAACVALSVGHLHDPVDVQGMAHFCEHMILKGTEPYPGEGEFRAFVTAHSGLSNGITGPTSTTYHFAVAPPHLLTGLSYLAAFFTSPLFTPALAAREVRAVDAEFRRNLQKDARRVLQLGKSLSKDGHPWNKFGTGSWESLSAVGRAGKNGGDASGAGTEEEDGGATAMLETRRRLVEWWKETYCASRMTLVVVGKDSFEDTIATAVPLFSKVENRGLDPRPAIKTPAWGPEHKGILVCAETVEDTHELRLEFELSDLRAHHDAARPAAFLAHLLGHEGPGSACALLRRRGWLLELVADGSAGDPRAVHLFQLRCKLTPEGYLNYESVLLILFQHIALLRASFPLPTHLFTEAQTLAHTHFRFQQSTPPHTYALALARAGAYDLPPAHALSGGRLYRAYDEALVQRVLAGFVPAEGRVFVLAKAHHPEVVGADVRWEEERWYGTRFCVRRMGGDLLERLSEPGTNEELALPKPNPFIPTDLSVDKVEVAEPAKHPTLITRTPCARLWHKKDDQFWVPKADVRLVVKSPYAYATPRHAVMTRMLIDLVEDALSEITYDADLAGLGYSLSCHDEGLSISVGGYNDKLAVLLHIVLDKLRTLGVDPERLNIVLDKIKREYANFYLGQPSNLSEQFAQWTLMPVVWTKAEKLLELTTIHEADIERHRDELLSKSFVEMLVNGNMTQARALEIMSLVEEVTPPAPLLPSTITAPRALELPPGSNFILRKRHANPTEYNSSLSYYLQFGAPADAKLRNTAALIHHIMREPLFTTLRTKEQLGYVVTATSWTINNSTLGLGVKIQSARAPWYTESRVDAFLHAFREQLAGLSPAELATHAEGLAAKSRERPKNLAEETARFWAHVRAGDYDFLRPEKDAETIQALTLSELLAAYDALVLPSSPVRRKLSVHLLPQQLPPDDGALPPPPPGAHLIVDADDEPRIASGDEPEFGEAECAFKAALACAPAAVPVPSAAFGAYETSVRSML